jgi:hypothetical protein
MNVLPGGISTALSRQADICPHISRRAGGFDSSKRRAAGARSTSVVWNPAAFSQNASVGPPNPNSGNQNALGNHVADWGHSVANATAWSMILSNSGR